jgi:hypothetical protein
MGSQHAGLGEEAAALTVNAATSHDARPVARASLCLPDAARGINRRGALFHQGDDGEAFFFDAGHDVHAKKPDRVADPSRECVERMHPDR